MKRIVIIFLFSFSFAVRLAYADMGFIPFDADVKIFEPTQRAMIAWNEEEEILLLSTDLYASGPTKVLEILPLPAQPTVKKGDVEVFKKAVELINSKLRVRVRREHSLGIGSGGSIEKPAGEVTFHEKIGAHDISVTHVLDSKGFIDWVQKYLKSKGVDNPTIPEPLKEVVSEYLDEGISWFVFGVVELDNKPKTTEAIQYRFSTKSLFYPLRISRSAEGETAIELLVLTPKLLSYFKSHVNFLHEPISITSAELRSLNEEMDALLGHRQNMKLRIWRIEGLLSGLNEDLVAN